MAWRRYWDWYRARPAPARRSRRACCRDLDRESAARFSFLLSIPAITGAGLYKLVKVIKSHDAALHDDKAKYLLAAVVAGAFAYAVVRWFMGYMKEHNTGIFIAYRIVFGLAILGLFHSGHLTKHHAEDPKTAPAADHAVSRNKPVKAPVRKNVSGLLSVAPSKSHAAESASPRQQSDYAGFGDGK